MQIEKTTYAVRAQNVDGVIFYSAIFTDGAGNRQEVEIPGAVFSALEECRLAEKRQDNAFERHIEHAALFEEELAARMAVPSAPIAWLRGIGGVRRPWRGQPAAG